MRPEYLLWLWVNLFLLANSLWAQDSSDFKCGVEFQVREKLTRYYGFLGEVTLRDFHPIPNRFKSNEAIVSRRNLRSDENIFKPYSLETMVEKFTATVVVQDSRIDLSPFSSSTIRKSKNWVEVEELITL
jgi:hypothetical protein